MQSETLKAFLKDEILREELKAKYKIDDSKIDNITMTSAENFIEIIVIKEIIKKQADNITANIASGQIMNLLEGRIK